MELRPNENVVNLQPYFSVHSIGLQENACKSQYVQVRFLRVSRTTYREKNHYLQVILVMILEKHRKIN